MTHSIRVPQGRPVKKSYTGAKFIEELTDSELESLILMGRTSDQMAAIFERIKIVGIDFNIQRNISIIERMVSTGIFDDRRKNELIG